MSHYAEHPPESFGRELIIIAQRAGQIWKLVPPRQRWTLSVAVLLMALGGVSNTAIPLLLGQLVDTVRDAAPRDAASDAITKTVATPFVETAGWFLGLIGLAYLLREALQVGRRYLVEDTCTQLEKHLFVTLVSHLMMADLATLSQDKIGSLHGRIHRNVGGSVRFLRVGFLDFFPALLSGGLALTAVVARQPWLGLIMAGVIPMSVTITLRQLVSQKGVRLELLRCREELDGTVVEQLSGIDDIRAANTHEREMARVERAVENLRTKELQHHFVMSLYGSGKAISEGLFHILVLGAAVYLASVGRISFGDILTYSMLFLSVMAPLNEVHRVIDEGHESSLLVGELLKMLAEPPDRSYCTASDPQPMSARQPALSGDRVITIENLFVDYGAPASRRKRAVDGLSLAIRRGEIIGIAGRSGCGKTTFLRTLMRLVHPSGGRVALGDIPLEEVSRADIARWIGYVGQTPFVFSGTIEDNIAYEHLAASRDDIRRAASQACFDDEIMAMTGGYHARITERGHNLSGGQRQRLALARVFLKNPPILILDEATSALDTISERHVQESLASQRGERTVILVAHRLSTLLHTDRILVFEEGRIVETGTYEELVAHGGVFSELVQSAEAKDDDELADG
jgi:ATP-binding cassette, subfamily B, bacterial